MPKSFIAVFIFLSPFLYLLQIKAKLTPIKIYKILQTGAKSQFGGLKKGLSKKTYHEGIAGVVTSPPREPIAKLTIEEIIIFAVLLIQIIIACVYNWYQVV